MRPSREPSKCCCCALEPPELRAIKLLILNFRYTAIATENWLLSVGRAAYMGTGGPAHPAFPLLACSLRWSLEVSSFPSLWLALSELGLVVFNPWVSCPFSLGCWHH
jgi:hypothetical protein